MGIESSDGLYGPAKAVPGIYVKGFVALAPALADFLVGVDGRGGSDSLNGGFSPVGSAGLVVPGAVVDGLSVKGSSRSMEETCFVFCRLELGWSVGGGPFLPLGPASRFIMPDLLAWDLVDLLGDLAAVGGGFAAAVLFGAGVRLVGDLGGMVGFVGLLCDIMGRAGWVLL